LAYRNASGHFLRNLHKDAKLFGLRQMKKFPAACSDDQITGINIAYRDNAGKRGNHPGKRLNFFQSAHLGSSRIGNRGLQLEICLFFSGILFADAGGC
jgi:hypothetical protein